MLTLTRMKLGNLAEIRQQMSKTRKPAVAGRFYPAEAGALQNLVDEFISNATSHAGGPFPRALIAPHAGYPYSGRTAGSAFASWRDAPLQRIVLIGPAHYKRVSGLALSSATSFATPLGEIPVDVNSVAALERHAIVTYDDQAHAPEHCLEVELPFLQRVLSDFTLVPLLAGEVDPSAVTEVLEPCLRDGATGIVVSSDLSHFHTYKVASELDAQTARNILTLNELDNRQACGYRPINGLLRLARSNKLAASQLALTNSGDAGGAWDRVVGYGAFAFVEDV